MIIEPFWLDRALESFSIQEWESLCDGCGKCCLHKLEDSQGGAVTYTRVACQLLDTTVCQCKDYSRRQLKVKDCLQVTPAMAKNDDSLPNTCAYRLIAQGADLPEWHPLKTGDKASTIKQGKSVADRVLSEIYVHPDGLDEHVISWVEA